MCGRNRLENGSIDRLAVGLRNHEDLEVVRPYQNASGPGGYCRVDRDGLVKRKIKVLTCRTKHVDPEGAGVLAESSWLGYAGN